MKKIIFYVLLIVPLLVCCQPKKTEKQVNCPREGFCIQDSLLLYNGKKIEVSTDIACLTKVLGNYDRMIEDKWGGDTISNYYWIGKKLAVNKHSANNYFTLIKFKIDQKNGNFKDDNNDSYQRYNTLDEIITKYGKYDSLNIEYSKVRAINRFYSWDSLGIQAVSVNDSLREITLLIELKKILDYSENPRYPNDTYKSKLTINGITLDLTEKKYDTWTNSMKALGILSKDYAPPGDSKDWTRYLKLKYFFLSFDRDPQVLTSRPFNYNNVQKIPDYINQVSIGINTIAFDKLKKENE